MKQFIFVATSILFFIGFQITNQDKPINDFENWQIKYSKFYFGEEKLFREKVFLDNQMKIQMHNTDPSQTYKMGENQFMSLTNEEFASIYSSQIPLFETEQDETSKVIEETSFEEKKLNPVDYRDKLTVHDRGNCGAGWAFSVTGAIDALYMLTKNQKIASSPQELIDCDVNTQHGCLGVYSKLGRGYQGGCYPKTHLYKISSVKQLKQESDALQQSLQTSAISVGIDARNWQFYKSGIFRNCEIIHTDYVLLVGFDVSRNWIVQSSFGYQWGMNGSIILASGNTCGILRQAFEAR